jgi:4a-hydroxytetrahydrobiopterin dehydratase
MSQHKLTEDEIGVQLAHLPAWNVKYGKLHREYQFPNFALAIGFITASAVMIEKRNHHPEWFNVYNRVIVDLTTHDSGGITQKDVDVAILMEQLSEKFTAKIAS